MGKNKQGVTTLPQPNKSGQIPMSLSKLEKKASYNFSPYILSSITFHI